MGLPKEKAEAWPSCTICGEAAVSTRTLLCRACYQSLRYHLKLGTAHVAQWAVRVQKFATRAAYATGSKKPFTTKLKRVK